MYDCSYRFRNDNLMDNIRHPFQELLNVVYEVPVFHQKHLDIQKDPNLARFCAYGVGSFLLYLPELYLTNTNGWLTRKRMPLRSHHIEHSHKQTAISMRQLGHASSHLFYCTAWLVPSYRHHYYY